MSYDSHPFGTIACGELAGATSATQLPDVPCRLAKLKAQASNAGNVSSARV